MLKRKKQKKGFFAEQYSESFSYIKKSQNFIYSTILIFLLFAIIGLVFPAPTYLIEQIKKFIEDLLKQTEGLGQWELIQFIFLNNLKSSFFGMLFGIFLGILPVVGALSNGYVLGFVSKLVVVEEGLASLWRLFPHGIFELPAIFISLGLGLKLGSFIFKKYKADSFRDYFWNSLRVFIFVVLPLLIIAAIIEGSLIFLLE